MLHIHLLETELSLMRLRTYLLLRWHKTIYYVDQHRDECVFCAAMIVMLLYYGLILPELIR